MIDRLSPTWVAVMKWAADRETALLKRLVKDTTSFEDTQFIRGQIDALHKLRGLPEATDGQ